MVEFYTWPWAARTSITFCFALCVLFQTLALVLCYYRHPRGRKWVFETLLEVLVLCQILACSLLHGQVVNAFELGFIPPTGYGALRIILFALLAITAALVVVLDKRPWPLLVILVSGLTLPVMELLAPDSFAALFLIALFYWLVRGVHISILRYRELKKSISALSIKNAIDSMRTGILFCEPDGFILLSNAQMQRLMVMITGKVRHNGKHFYELLSSSEIEPGCQRVEFEEQAVCLLPDHTAWMFVKTDLRIKGKAYCQLTATDVTDQWELTSQLRVQNKQLMQRSEELRDTIANLHILSRERETQKAKMRAHDILGQRLTLLLRTLRNQQTLDSAALGVLAEGLLEDLKARAGAPVPQDELDSLRQVFASIGVGVQFFGRLPVGAEQGRLVVEIIRECVTNAVRHGFATEVSVTGDDTDDGYHLEIGNNGQPPPEPIVEGGGIGGMRKKVEPHGGALHVIARPHFVLKVDLPGGDVND